MSAAGSGYLVLDILRYAGIPASRGTPPVRPYVTVPTGQGFRVTAEHLNQAGFIENPLKFRLFAFIKGYDKKIKAGEYLFTSAMTPADILDMMAKGKVFQYKVTVPEGYNLRQIASLIAATGLGTAEDFLKAASDPDFIRKKGFDAPTFEGYLFPETYYFPRNVRPTQMISAMVRQFRRVFTPEWETQAEALGLSVHEAVTLASIIEKETGDPSERPLIASVFHNRLKKGMRLESDPTVIYGIENLTAISPGNISERPQHTILTESEGFRPGPLPIPEENLLKQCFTLRTPDISFLSQEKTAPMSFRRI